MSVTERSADINGLEREIFEQCCKLGRAAMSQILEKWDESLKRERDRRKYRHKGSRKRVLKTVMGEVEYSRSLYECRDEDWPRRYVYLLDEAMGVVGTGFLSGLLSEQIVQSACQMSYRSAAQTVSELTGQTVSHMTAWSVVQELGARLDTQEKEAAQRARQDKGRGQTEVKLLFEEQDGVFLSLQGKDRKEYGKREEMKLAIAYSGARAVGPKRYELTDKAACANFEGIRQFSQRKEGVFADTYNMDEVEVRVLNGDGAQWIRNSAQLTRAIYQLDTFHRNRGVLTYVPNAEMRKEIFRLMYSKQIDQLLEYIEALSNSVEDEDEREGILALLSYFTNNRDGLVAYHRRGLQLPAPKEGTVYRHCGAAESHIYTILGRRMKGGRASWSVKGGNNLARLLCLKTTKKLSFTLRRLTTASLPEKYAEEVTDGLASGSVAFSAGKGYDGYRTAAIPGVFSLKWLKGIASLRDLSDMPLDMPF